MIVIKSPGYPPTQQDASLSAMSRTKIADNWEQQHVQAMPALFRDIATRCKPTGNVAKCEINALAMASQKAIEPTLRDRYGWKPNVMIKGKALFCL